MLQTLQAKIQANREQGGEKRNRNETQLQRKQHRTEHPSHQRYTNVPTPRPSFSRCDYVIQMHVGGELYRLTEADIIQLFQEELGIVHIRISSNKIIYFAFVIILRRDAVDLLPSGCRERVVLFKGRKIKISVANNQQIRHSQLVIMQNGEEICGFHANGSCEHDHHSRSGNCLFGRHLNMASPPVRSQKRNGQQQQMTKVAQDTRICELLEQKDGRNQESAAPIRKRVGPGMIQSINDAVESQEAAVAVSSSSSEEDEEVSPPQEVSPASRVPLPRGREGGPTAFQAFHQVVTDRLVKRNISYPAFPVINRNLLEGDNLPPLHDEEDRDEEDVVRGYDGAMASRLSARAHLASWKKSIEGKACHLSDEEIIAFLSGECSLCGRLPTNGVTPCNTIDRLDSSIRLYRKDLCCTLCQDCNGLKLWLKPAEFLETICLWSHRRQDILNYLPGIRDCQHLEELAREEPNGKLAKIPSEALSHTRKGRNSLLTNATLQPIILDIVTSPCSFCGQASGFGLDRLYSCEPYKGSMRNGRLLSCCSRCNVIWLNRDREELFVHVIRIYNHVSQVDPETLDEFQRRVYNIFCDTSALDTSLTWMNSNQRPVATDIGGHRLIVPSIRVLREYAFGSRVTDGGSLRVTNVSIPEYKSWLWSQDTRSLSQLRLSIGVTRDLNDRIEINEEQDDILVELDALAEEADAQNITRSRRAWSRGWDAIGARIDEMGSDSDSEDESESESGPFNSGSNSEDNNESTRESGPINRDSYPNYLDESGSYNSSDDSDYLHESNSVSSDNDDSSLDSYFDDRPDPETRSINVVRAPKDMSIVRAPKDMSIKDLVLDPRGRGDRAPEVGSYYCKVTTCTAKAQANCHRMCIHHKTLFEDQDRDNDRGWKVEKAEKDMSIKDLVLDPRGRGDRAPEVGSYYCKVTTCTAKAQANCHRMCIHHKNLFQDQDRDNDRGWRST